MYRGSVGVSRVSKLAHAIDLFINDSDRNPILFNAPVIGGYQFTREFPFLTPPLEPSLVKCETCFLKAFDGGEYVYCRLGCVVVCRHKLATRYHDKIGARIIVIPTTDVMLSRYTLPVITKRTATRMEGKQPDLNFRSKEIHYKDGSLVVGDRWRTWGAAWKKDDGMISGELRFGPIVIPFVLVPREDGEGNDAA